MGPQTGNDDALADAAQTARRAPEIRVAKSDGVRFRVDALDQLDAARFNRCTMSTARDHRHSMAARLGDDSNGDEGKHITGGADRYQNHLQWHRNVSGLACIVPTVGHVSSAIPAIS